LNDGRRHRTVVGESYRTMILKSRSWGEAGRDGIVCVHGVGQHGGIFAGLGECLAERGHLATAVDLRGHGDSGREPPWSVERHLQDLLETLDARGIRRAALVGHSFGGRVAAALAAAAGERIGRLVLLEPGLQIPPDRALQGAEMDRLDWSFETPEGAVNALLGRDEAVATPREVAESYVRDDVREGPDGRYRFRFCPGAAVTAWSEMALPAPPIAPVPTLIVRTEVSLVSLGVEQRYRDELGARLTVATVPNGHNVLWESPAETFAAVTGFLESGVEAAAGALDEGPVPGYFESSGAFRPLA
jgi:lipase